MTEVALLDKKKTNLTNKDVRELLVNGKDFPLS